METHTKDVYPAIALREVPKLRLVTAVAVNVCAKKDMPVKSVICVK